MALLTKQQLKDACKERGFSGLSRLTRHELIDRLVQSESAVCEWEVPFLSTDQIYGSDAAALMQRIQRQIWPFLSSSRSLSRGPTPLCSHQSIFLAAMWVAISGADLQPSCPVCQQIQLQPGLACRPRLHACAGCSASTAVDCQDTQPSARYTNNFKVRRSYCSRLCCISCSSH